MSEARRYQQLRAHRAYLKLNDAGGRGADLDRARLRVPHGAAGRGLVGGAPASVVTEHGARLRDGVGAVVDVPGGARRGRWVAGGRGSGRVRVPVVAAQWPNGRA